MADERLCVGEVVEVAAPPQAHVAAEVLPLHVLEKLVGAVEPQRQAAVAAMVTELARRMAGHVCGQLGRRPGLKLQRERPMLLQPSEELNKQRRDRNVRRATLDVRNMAAQASTPQQAGRLLRQQDVHYELLHAASHGIEAWPRPEWLPGVHLQADGADAALMCGDDVRQQFFVGRERAPVVGLAHAAAPAGHLQTSVQ